ncbi:MAG: helix-turn-helix transcriptional regulator [Mycobacterium leprae]
MGVPKLLSIAEVSALTRLSEATWRWYRHVGFRPPAFKLGRRIFWREDDVVAWIEQNKTARPNSGGAA